MIRWDVDDRPLTPYTRLYLKGMWLNRDKAAFEPEQEERFRADAAAWAYWTAAPAGYRKMATWWVVSAKKPETRARRLGILIESSAAGEKIPGYDIGRKKA